MKLRLAPNTYLLCCSLKFILLAFLYIAPLLAKNSFADSYLTPDSLPSWNLSASSDGANGLILSGGEVGYSSPVIAEIDGNTANGKEMTVGGADGRVHVFHADGTLAWNADTPIAACSGGSTNKIFSSPAVGELYGDGMPYVVIGYGGFGARQCDGGVIALRGSDGATQWIFSTKKFSKKEKFWAFRYSVFSSPALADTDGDGKLEVGFGSFDRNVYLLEADGSVRWYYNAADTVWSSPAFADIDDDSELEMIIGTDISGNSRIKPITKNGGFVYAFKTSKRKRRHINFRDPTSYVWKTSFDQVIYSSPSIGDVLPNVPGNEIVIGSGCFFPQNSQKKKGKWFKILRARDGKVVQTLATEACSSSSAALGDIDGNGSLEVVATVNGSGKNGAGKIQAWEPITGTLLWTTIPYERGKNSSQAGNFISPVLADIDGNGSVEVIVANSASVGVYEGTTGLSLTCQLQDCGNTPYLLFANKNIQSSPAVGDVNKDGVLDVVVAGRSNASSGAIYGWTNLHLSIVSSPGTLAAYSTPWAMYRGNYHHRALYGE